MKEKLTPIFPPKVKPVHVGVYMASTGKEEESVDGEYCYWNGRLWGISTVMGADKAEAQFHRSGPSMFQDRYWRGLATEPK